MPLSVLAFKMYKMNFWRHFFPQIHLSLSLWHVTYLWVLLGLSGELCTFLEWPGWVGTSQIWSPWCQRVNGFEFGVIKHGWQHRWEVLYWLSFHSNRNLAIHPPGGMRLAGGMRTERLNWRRIQRSSSRHALCLFRFANDEQTGQFQSHHHEWKYSGGAGCAISVFLRSGRGKLCLPGCVIPCHEFYILFPFLLLFDLFFFFK
jgi:hypothetical protein